MSPRDVAVVMRRRYIAVILSPLSCGNFYSPAVALVRSQF
jgi:hypothetical protein